MAAALCNLDTMRQSFHYQQDVTDEVELASGCSRVSNPHERDPVLPSSALLRG